MKSTVTLSSGFQRLVVSGFRRIFTLDLELRPLGVMIGANGVGKSSLLDVFRLLRACATTDLRSAVSYMGGINELLTYDAARELRFLLELAMEPASMIYDLSIRASGNSYSIYEEVLSQHRDHTKPQSFKYIDSRDSKVRYTDPASNGLVTPTWEHDPLETSLGQVPKMYQQPEHFRALLASVEHYHWLPIEPRSPVRLPQTLSPVTVPGIQGESLIACLYNLQQIHPERFEMLTDTLRVAFPGFERLAFPTVASGRASLTWKEREFSRPAPVDALSEGTLRFLWLAAILYGPELPTVLLLDEPEVSLHPRLLGLLAEMLREAAQRSQVLVATHSDLLVRCLEPAEVLAMDRDESGLLTAAWGDSLDLDRWLADYSLDQIWDMGVLGGR